MATTSVFEKRNPFRPSEIVGTFPASGAEEAAAAVTAAADALPGWASTPAPARAAVLSAAANALERRSEQVAQDMTAEMGKPLRESRGEAARGAAILRYYASEALRPVGERYEQSLTNGSIYTMRRPIGVVGLITPWNFPVAIPLWKAAPALVYGNTVVLKLSLDAPRSGLHVAECLAEAGIPPGVLNVLTGEGSTAGAALVEDPRVAAISFTGSTAVGRTIRDTAVRTNKRVQLELGGQNPLIVMADANIPAAVDAAFAGAYWSAGQKCTATRRIFVEASVADLFTDQLLGRMERAKVGDPSDPETEVGPLVSERQLAGVLAGIERARSEGARLLRGGVHRPSDGHLVTPALFENVPEGSVLSCDEIFGPVAALYPFEDLGDAIRQANAVEYGLCASIFTNSLASARRFTAEAEAGILHINSQTAGAEPHVPFGGTKASAYGPHEQGRATMEFYTELVTVYEDAL